MITKTLTQREATGFIRGGMLFLEPPHRWRLFNRTIWNCGNVGRVTCNSITLVHVDGVEVRAGDLEAGKIYAWDPKTGVMKEA